MNDMQKYLRQVKRCLPGTKEQKIWILDQVRAQIMESPTPLSYTGILEFVGPPEQVAATQIEALPALQIAQSVRRDFWIKRVVISFLALLLILITIALTVAVIDTHKQSHGDPYEGTITTIQKDPIFIEEVEINEK